MRAVGARRVFHMLQFNGKQGDFNAMHAGQAGLPERRLLTCAVPATVNGRMLHLQSKAAFSFHYEPLIGLKTIWEGDEGSSVSPDTGQ